MRKGIFNSVVIAVIAGVGFLIWQKLQLNTLDPTPSRVTENLTIPASVQSGEIQRAEPTPALPPPKVAAPITLDNSDASVRLAITDFAPQLLQWLTPAEQIRKWTMLVDAIADGSIPNDRLPLAYAVKPFQGAHHGEGFIIDKTNFERAAPLINTITAIPPERMVQYYRAWQPLLERAYRELGRRDSFDTRLRIALSRISAAHPLPENTELSQPGVYFVFNNPDYEKASDVEKLLWRIGPDNTQHIQAYLNKVRQLL